MIYYNCKLRWKKYTAMVAEGVENAEVDSEDEVFERPVRTRHLGGVQKNLHCLYPSEKLQELNDEFYSTFVREEKYLIHITQRTDSDISAYIAVEIEHLNDTDWKEVLAKSFPDCEVVSVKECTVGECKEELMASQLGRYNRALDRMRIDYRAGWMDPYPFELSENVQFSVKMTKVACKKRAHEILGSKSLYEEIDRIYSKENRRAYYGHPVHYMISAGDWGGARDICELLINALSANGRLLSTRQTVIRQIGNRAYKDERYEKIIAAAEGGIVMLELEPGSDMGRFATDFHELTKRTGEILEKHKKDTLFIFVEITGKSLKSNDAMNNIISKADFIHITEGTGTPAQAKQYLAELVSKVEFASDSAEEAAEYLPDAESYSVTDIFKAYNAWYGSGLKNHVYKAYKEQRTLRVESARCESKPYEELQALIGLSDAKRVVDEILASAKMLRARERMGLNTEGASLHMLFSGSPGTAKTTVARLLAKILKDEDAVSSGRFVECGRQDLVGKYVGWTARIVEDKFKQASGGVLFIDEAYSLVDSSNTYGAEAINTITQLMENYRNEVIVIFAGYPDKMKTFLEQNEGLKSRIAFHLDFPDYTADELVDILKLQAKKREYTLDEAALDYSRDIFAEAVGEANFGNGRYARNLLEQAILRQSNRIVRETPEDAELTKEDICLLKREDISPLSQGIKSSGVRLGFC